MTYRTGRPAAWGQGAVEGDLLDLPDELLLPAFLPDMQGTVVNRYGEGRRP